jgi:hypothetical protein
MYVHGMVTNGIWSVYLDYEDGNHEEYGIDWEDMDRPAIRCHHDTFNLENGNPFVVNHPDHLSHVEVPDAQCHFDAHQLYPFNTELQNLPTILFTDMHSHRLTWINALALATAVAHWLHKIKVSLYLPISWLSLGLYPESFNSCVYNVFIELKMRMKLNFYFTFQNSLVSESAFGFIALLEGVYRNTTRLCKDVWCTRLTFENEKRSI